MIDATSTFLRIENAAHSGAFGNNALPEPTEAQCIAGNYKVGRVSLHGLRLAIEQPRGTYRTGLDAKTGQRWASRMAAHYGYIVGTTGADGDGVDCFIGFYPQSETAYVINQNVGGRFDEHKVMLAFPDEETARRAYQDSYERGWDGLASIVPASISQLKQWLKSGDMRRPLRSEDLPQEGLETMTRKVQWDGNALPYDVTLDQVLYDIRRADACDGLLMDAVTAKDILEDSDGVLTLDALVSPYSRLERKMELLRVVMERAGHKVKPVAVQITEPFKQRGVANVAVIYELSDGQTVSIYFHNPDVTPNKIAPTDEVVSWKWMLNKKDITIVVAPERGDELNVREVARRIMRLAEKNSPTFQRINAKRAERMGAIQGLKDEISGLEKELATAQHELEVAKVEVEEAQNRKSRDYAQAVQKSSVTQDAYVRATDNGGIDHKTGRTKEDIMAQVDREAADIQSLRDIASGAATVSTGEQAVGKKFDDMTFEEAKAKADALWDASTQAGKVLDAFPKGPMGLTPDDVRATPEWKSDKSASDAAMKALRDFNAQYTKKFKTEIISARDAKREEKLAAAGGADQQATPARAWQEPANRDADPAGGAEVIESWNTAKADGLLEQVRASNADNAPEFHAREFIAKHLQGRTVKTQKGDCIINATSRSKLPLAANRKGSVKLEAIARIPEILILGEAGELEALKKLRDDALDGFYQFSHTFDVPRKNIKVKARLQVGHRELAPNLVYSLEATNGDVLDDVKGYGPAISRSLSVITDKSYMGSSGAAGGILDHFRRPVNLALDAAEESSDGLNLTIIAVWDKDGNRVHELEDGAEKQAPGNSAAMTAPAEPMSEQALIDAYVKAWGEEAAQINAAVAAINWIGIIDTASANAEIQRLRAAVNENRPLVNARNALEGAGIRTWDKRLDGVSDTAGFKAQGVAMQSYRDAVNKIQVIAKDKLIEAGMVFVGATGNERVQGRKGRPFMYSDDDAVDMMDALFAAQQAPAIALTGNELGEFPDTPEGLKALREAAKSELMQLRGEWIDVPALQDADGKPRKVEIRKRSIKEFIRFGANPNKLKMVSKIREIIASATNPKWEGNFKTREKPSVVGYYRMSNTVSVGGSSIPVTVLIEQDENNLLHYDLLLPEKAKAALDSAALLPTTPPDHKSEIADDAHFVTLDAVSQGRYVLNLFIEGEDPDYVEVAEDPASDSDAQPQQGADDVDYLKMFTPEVLKHLRDSVLAAQYEDNSQARIESDRILALFGDTLTTQQYKNYDWNKAEDVLFGKLEEIEKELGLGAKEEPQKDEDGVLGWVRSLCAHLEQLGWSGEITPIDKERPNEGTLEMDSPRPRKRGVKLVIAFGPEYQPEGFEVMDGPSVPYYTEYPKPNSAETLAVSIDAADYADSKGIEADETTGLVTDSESPYFDMPAAVPYAADMLQEAVKEQGCAISWGNFTASLTTPSLLDAAGVVQPDTVAAQIGHDGTVIARAEITRAGEVILYRGATGSEVVAQSANKAKIGSSISVLVEQSNEAKPDKAEEGPKGIDRALFQSVIDGTAPTCWPPTLLTNWRPPSTATRTMPRWWPCSSRP
jgi:hypothetical protein